MSTGVERARGLERDGITTDRARWNLSPAALYEESIRRGEALLAAEGPLACRTGPHTGRAPTPKHALRRAADGACGRRVGQGQPADGAGAVRPAAPRSAGHARRQGSLRPRLLRRRRPEVSAGGTHHQRARVAPPVPPQTAPP